MQEKFLEFVDNSDKISVITGAGISAESGVPTFRGEDGLWNNYRAEELATLSAFNNNPKLVWEWYNWRRGLISKCLPNPAHYYLADLEKNRKDYLLITQNVDGLHVKAGSKKVIEIHGSIWKIKCVSCHYNEENLEEPLNYPPLCPECNNLLRPDVVWFGEALDYNKLSQSLNFIKKSDLLIVIGTSGVVQPVASFPVQGKNANPNLKIVEINLYETPITRFADLFINAKSGEFFKGINNV